MLIKVAWRNIWRHKTRSAVICIAVMFGLWAGLFIQAYTNGMVEGRVTTAIQKEVSHIQLHHPEFKKDNEARFVITDGDSILNYISQIDFVKAVTGRVVSRGMVATATGSAGIKINGVDPSEESTVTYLDKSMVEGEYFSKGGRNEILIGEKLFKKLKLKLNAKVILTLLDKENTIISGAFRIAGVYRTQNAPYDETNVFVKRNEIAGLLNTLNEYHEIAILLNSNESLDSVTCLIRNKFPLVKQETWMEVSPEVGLIVSTTDQSLLIYMSIIMLALAFGIINTMLMAVLERTRELGMLMALGMSKARVFVMILLETIFLVFTGTPLGLLLGFLTTVYFGNHGIDMSSFKDVYASFGFSEIIYPKLNVQDYYRVLELVVITSVISALFPARRALSMRPSEAIRK